MAVKKRTQNTWRDLNAEKGKGVSGQCDVHTCKKKWIKEVGSEIKEKVLLTPRWQTWPGKSRLSEKEFSKKVFLLSLFASNSDMLGSSLHFLAAFLVFLLCLQGQEGSQTRHANSKKSDPFLTALARKSNVSSLAKFLTEPQLGTSWYNPDGPTPNFMSEEMNGTVYRSRLGEDALLSCRVTSLERDLVSWFRRDSEDQLPVVLTVGFKPHSSENRFILDFKEPNDYRLRIQSVQWRDKGIYLCQLSVYPPKLMWSRLELGPPVVHRLDGDSNPVRELHYDSGSTIELVCRVKRPPLYHVTVMWTVTKVETGSETSEKTGSASGKKKKKRKVRRIKSVLNQDVTRGGVKVDTGRDERTGNLISRLSLARAHQTDTGKYTCMLWKDGKPDGPRGLDDSISVHVLRGENTEAIQSAGSSNFLSVFCFILAVIWSSWSMFTESIFYKDC